MYRISLLLPAMLLSMAWAQEGELLNDRTRDLLHEALSGEIAKEHVIEITRHHRIQGSRGYRASAQYVLEQLHALGFSQEDAYIESFRSDGRVHYQGWQSPSGWDIEWGELRMLQPVEQRIVGYPEIAMSVITYSNPGDVTAELVWVGEGTDDADYDGKDVEGKFVLATGYGGAVHRLAVLKYGAAAVVCYLDDTRAQEYPDMLQYTGMWPNSDELEDVTFGFNLTNRQGESLRELLEQDERVVLRGQIEGIGLESFFMDVVVAHIRGSRWPEEEVVFSAHLDHPKESANDNASGSAAILDIAGALNRLIDDGRLERPKRSIRFLWVPEWYGTMAYIDAHPELAGSALGGKFLANLNLDMVGENTELLHSKLIMTRTPDAMPSVLNSVVADMAGMVDDMNIRTPRGSLSAFNYRLTPFSGGSDHMMFIERKIPGMMFSHSPDYTHHTSEDTPDKVDPVELERCEMIAAGAFIYLANLTAGQLPPLIRRSAAESIAALATAFTRSAQFVDGATSNGTADMAWAEAQNVLDHALNVGQGVIASTLDYNRGDEDAVAVAQDLAATYQAELNRQHQTYTEWLRGGRPGFPPGFTFEVDSRVPERITHGPLAFDLPESKLSEEGAAWYTSAGFPFSRDQRYEVINYVDGQRTVSEIRNAMSAEFTPFDMPDVSRYLEDLVSVGALKWRE